MTPGKILTLALGALIALSTPAIARSDYSGLNFSAHDITTLASVGVTPEYIHQIQALGYKDISAHDITTLYSVGVQPEYVQQTKKLGYNLSAHDITTLYSAGVTPEYIQQMISKGSSKFSAHDLTTLSSIGVTPEYVRQIRDLGYKEFSAHDFTTLYTSGITPEYIKQLKKSGQHNLSAHDIITLYSSGVSSDYIKQLKKPGQHKVHIPEIHIPEIHIPEIHIPEVYVNVPNIDVKVKTNPVAASKYEYEYKTDSQSMWNTIAKNIAITLMLALIGCAIYFIYRKRNVVPATEPLDTRINNFEKRVNDLQDILLSIDNRLDRRIRQN